jgi:hypothetical protein
VATRVTGVFVAGATVLVATVVLVGGVTGVLVAAGVRGVLVAGVTGVFVAGVTGALVAGVTGVLVGVCCPFTVSVPAETEVCVRLPAIPPCRPERT